MEIEGLKSPDTSLLLPDLLPMTDPFGSTSDAVIGNITFYLVMPAVGAGGSSGMGIGGGEQKCPRPP